jgi:predicted acylesterase/phospholipase RssA
MNSGLSQKEMLRGHDRFQVLALDGGGAKALFSAHILARLEADLGIRG